MDHRQNCKIGSESAGVEYPAGSRVLKVDSDGKIKLKGEHWLISRALSGERIQMVAMEHCVMVTTAAPWCGNSTWLPDESSAFTVTDVAGHLVNHVVELDTKSGLSGPHALFGTKEKK